MGSDYKPLEELTLPDLGALRCAGLIVVVGPNSSGKSQLLQDVYQRLCGEPRALVVASDVRLMPKPAYSEFSTWLQDEGYCETFVDDAGNQQLRPLRTYAGSGNTVSTIPIGQAQNWHNAYVPPAESHVTRRSE
jgi:hypothetical protein